MFSDLSRQFSVESRENCHIDKVNICGPITTQSTQSSQGTNQNSGKQLLKAPGAKREN